jgi:hypothetical protein
MKNPIFSFPRTPVKRRFASRDVSTTLTIEREGVEFEVEVAGTYNPGRPEVRYLRNGDPGHPEEPAEIVDLVATTEDGRDVELTEKEQQQAIEALIETLSE